jgi:hypothetical protein
MKKFLTSVYEIIKDIQQARAEAVTKGKYWY